MRSMRAGHCWPKSFVLAGNGWPTSGACEAKRKVRKKRAVVDNSDEQQRQPHKPTDWRVGRCADASAPAVNNSERKEC